MHALTLEMNGPLMYEMTCLNLRIILWNGRTKARSDYTPFDSTPVKFCKPLLYGESRSVVEDGCWECRWGAHNEQWGTRKSSGFICVFTSVDARKPTLLKIACFSLSETEKQGNSEGCEYTVVTCVCNSVHPSLLPRIMPSFHEGEEALNEWVGAVDAGMAMTRTDSIASEGWQSLFQGTEYECWQCVQKMSTIVPHTEPETTSLLILPRLARSFPLIQIYSLTSAPLFSSMQLDCLSFPPNRTNTLSFWGAVVS